MKLSQSGLETNKIENLGDTFAAQELLLQTGQLVQYASGLFGLNNIPLRTMRNIEKVIRDVLDKYGFVEVSLPILQPESLWQESGRWDKYIADGVMLAIKTEKGNFGLAPTAEEAVVNFVKGRVKSYKSLPVTFYQIGDKYRNEIRNRGYLMRGKAFNMMDAYSFDASEKEMNETYEKFRAAYMEIFKALGLSATAVAADGGAIGDSKSEEFMILSDMGEDKILIDKKTGRGLNIEILERPDHKEYLKKEYGIADITQLEEKRALELGHIFQLGKKYSQSMDATFKTADDKAQHFWMGCYGIGVSRTLATIYEQNILKDANGKVNGISLPMEVAPYKIQIISKPDNAEKVAQALELYNYLKSNGIECILDDRDVTLGTKIQDAKKLGTPYLAILGDKSVAGQIEVEETRTGKKNNLNKEELIKCLS